MKQKSQLWLAGVSILVLATITIGQTRAQRKRTPLPPPAAAQTPTTAAPIEDAIRAMFGVHEFQQAEISPDGKRVAWVETLTGKDGAPSPNSAIYVADIKNPAAAHRITAGGGATAYAEHDVAWSPDSKRLAFLSDAQHPGQLQLYIASAAGGVARRLTQLTGFLQDPSWSPDGKTLAVLFTENATRAAGPLVAETPAEGVVSEDVHEQRLALVDEKTGKVRQISPSDLYVYEYDWSPDGKRFVATAAHGSGDDNWYIAQLYTIDAAEGATESLLKPSMQIAVPRWSPDGSTIAFIGGLMSDEPVVGGEIYTIPASGGEAKNVTPGLKATASSLAWMPSSRDILFEAYLNGGSGVATANLSSREVHPLWAGAETIGPGDFGISLSVAPDGRSTAIVRQSFQHPPEVWAGPVGEWKQITHRNQGLESAWGSAENLHWKSDDFDIQGWLVYPRDFDSSKLYPLVVSVHGGPAYAITPKWPRRLDYEAALPAAGYFVLMPNPRGSYGQGEAFTRANVKDFGYGDFRDILGGVDAAAKAAPADSNRVGITGWSYGGYMTMWGVTQTNRFKAAVAGAGLANYQSYYGQNGIDQWMIPYFGASVYDDPAVYARSSPITFIKKARTPTLIVVGDRDGECPPPQSYEFWHALKTLGVPTEFVIYPNEGHEFANPAHSRDVIERTAAWFNRYL
ncbi:MAG: S9 family peptidase [Candidatus Acidiferrales bacterium]